MKMENFTRFASLYPEFSFVFFGDSGQGDALLASKLLAAFPGQVLGTFIHDVNPASDRTGDGQEKARYRSYVAARPVLRVERNAAGVELTAPVCL